jgi:hypothetical protein
MAHLREETLMRWWYPGGYRRRIRRVVPNSALGAVPIGITFTATHPGQTATTQTPPAGGSISVGKIALLGGLSVGAYFLYKHLKKG